MIIKFFNYRVYISLVNLRKPDKMTNQHHYRTDKIDHGDRVFTSTKSCLHCGFSKVRKYREADENGKGGWGNDVAIFLNGERIDKAPECIPHMKKKGKRIVVVEQAVPDSVSGNRFYEE